MHSRRFDRICMQSVAYLLLGLWLSLQTSTLTSHKCLLPLPPLVILMSINFLHNSIFLNSISLHILCMTAVLNRLFQFETYFEIVNYASFNLVVTPF